MSDHERFSPQPAIVDVTANHRFTLLRGGNGSTECAQVSQLVGGMSPTFIPVSDRSEKVWAEPKYQLREMFTQLGVGVALAGLAIHRAAQGMNHER